MAHSIYAYPWTLSSAALDSRVTELSDIGLDGISLACSYHAGKFIQPRFSNQRVVFPEDGTVYFNPRLDYAKLTPIVSRATEADDVLQTLTARNDIRVNAWTVLFHNTRLGLQHPEATVKNAFGDRYPYSLCPVNPDVQDYGRTLCQDIAQHYDVAQLLLETPGFLTYNHGYHHEFAQLPPNPWLQAWLGLCFCEHCVNGASQAGIDVAGLQQLAITRINQFLASPSAPSEDMCQLWIQADLVQWPELSAFLRWRCLQVTTLIEQIVESIATDTKVRVIATTQKPHATAFWEGTDVAALCGVADGVELPLYQPNVDAMASDADDVIRRVGSVDKLSAIVRPGWPDMHCETQLAASVEQLTAFGFSDIAFYHADMLPASNLGWLQRVLSGQRCAMH